MTTYDLFLFAGQSNMAGRGIACTQFPEGAPDLISGAGAEFRAISDPTRLYPIAEPFGALENNPTGIFEPGMKTGSLVTSFVNTYFQKYRRSSSWPVIKQRRLCHRKLAGSR
ncbi:MAG: hypothetical protein V8S84_13470 [Lachnospiraceae bacterium]